MHTAPPAQLMVDPSFGFIDACDAPTELDSEDFADEFTEHLHPDDLPTAKVDRRMLEAIRDELTEPTAPIMAPLEVENRDAATPFEVTDRVAIPPVVRQARPQRQKSPVVSQARPQRQKFVVPAPLDGPYRKTVPIEPLPSITVEDPVPLERPTPAFAPWSFADTYGWWMAGALVGGVVGSVVSGVALASVVMI